MAQGKTFNNSNFLKSLPSIHGPEVSAHWTRTKKGEVLVTMKMPRDTVDLEIYSRLQRTFRSPDGSLAVINLEMTVGQTSLSQQLHQTEVEEIQAAEGSQRNKSTSDCRKN